MADDGGAQGRLYRAVQILMATEADPPPAGPDRGVVALQDALDAVVQMAAVIDEQAQAGAIPAGRALFAGSLLMVIREHLQPLPANAPPGQRDAYTEDLQVIVDALRQFRSPDTVPDDLA